MAFAYVERIMDAPDRSLAAAASLSTIESGLRDLNLVGFEPIVVSNRFDSSGARIAILIWAT